MGPFSIELFRVHQKGWRGLWRVGDLLHVRGRVSPPFCTDILANQAPPPVMAGGGWRGPKPACASGQCRCLEGKVMATLMATETESWECMADSTPRSESVDMSRIIVSYSDSATGSLSRSASRESKGRAGSSNPDRLYISMAERMEQRKQRRQELEMRYECARKQQEEEKRMKEELNSTLDKLRRKAMAEQNRAVLRKQKQVSFHIRCLPRLKSDCLRFIRLGNGVWLQLVRETQQRRELLRQQRELASLHDFRRILLHYGLMPWHCFLLQCRKIVKKAAMNYDRLLKKRTLKWLYRRCIEGKSSPELHELHARGLALRAEGFQERWRLRYIWLYWIEGRRGEYHYQQFLLKRSCKALREILEYHRKLEKIGDERNQLRLLSGSWLKWTEYMRKEKRSQLLKYLELDQIASLHWQRVTYVRILRAWKDGIGLVRYEQKQSQHKAEAWTKIHFWLHEHKEVSMS